MQGTLATFEQDSLDGGRDLRRLFLQTAPACAAAAALAACISAWALRARPAAAPDFTPPPVILPAAPPAPAVPPPTEAASNPYGALSNPYAPFGALVDRAFFAEAGPAVAPPAGSQQASAEILPPAPAEAAPPAAAIPTPPQREAAEAGAPPLPPRRPAELDALAPAPPRVAAPAQSVATAPAAPADNRNLFEKLFDGGKPTSAAVAAAKPPEGRGGVRGAGLLAALFASSGQPAGYDKWTAVYDISARTVYMPDGTRLEAHSGLGDRLDDPRFVNERMRGATPPHLYELEPREASFHGVQALRLIPIGNGDLFGRAGLLAHSYMLGPKGDSNGCVSFKDYDAFLRAYQNGQIKRLAVVARLNG
ncbi:MAG TPA: DUF2778 domain-containing protein [Roseiarcus sp.]|nr:DUF2778 domain-containing protein [Roseiarcus sp.]